MSCSNFTDCQSCTAASYCHFCASDNACHAYGSPYGCSIGASCTDLANCVREQPEFKGFGPPPQIPMAVMVGSALFILSLICGCLYKVRRSKPSSIRPVIDDSLASRDYLELDLVGTGQRTIIHQPPKQSRRKFYCTVFLITSFIGVALGLLAALLLFPRVPTYALCSRNVDWAGILKGLTTGGVNANVDMQFSVYNPNRFEVAVSNATANFIWKGIPIGTGSLGPTSFGPGEIVDFTLNTRFTPGITTASQMLAAHYVGALFLDVDLDLHTSVKFFDTLSYSLQTNHTAAAIDVTAEVSRALCRCP